MLKLLLLIFNITQLDLLLWITEFRWPGALNNLGGRKDVVVVIVIRGCLGFWNAGSNLRGGR